MRLSELKAKPSNYEIFTLSLDGYIIHFFVMCDDQSAKSINEAKQKGLPLGGKYSALHHTVPEPGKEHLHIYARGNEILALNKDGTAHDGSHGTRIPNRVADAIRAHFPSFTLPPNNFIESAPSAVEISYKMKLLLS